MTSPSGSPLSELTNEELLQEIERRLVIAREKDSQARSAQEAVEEAFAELKRRTPLPLFPGE